MIIKELPCIGKQDQPWLGCCGPHPKKAHAQQNSQGHETGVCLTWGEEPVAKSSDVRELLIMDRDLFTSHSDSFIRSELVSASV